jgi:proliferating cell nuclear antigen PCNA
MSFNVKFYVKPFRDIFESISSLFPQVVLIFGEDGLDMQCMDTCKVALGELYIPPESFTNYDFDGDEADNTFRVKVGVDLGSFVKILKCVSGEAECELIYDEGDEDILTLAFKSQNELFEYELKLLSIPDTDLTIPERDEDACVVLSAAVYQKFTKDTI